MRLLFESSMVMPQISEVLSTLISGARIHIANIQYVESQRTVNILLERKELLGFKRSFFGTEQPTYSQNVRKTLLIIKDVIALNIKTNNRLVNELNSSFTVLLGVKIDSNGFHLGSVEEFQGETLCQVSIKTERYNIECIDLEN